MIYTERLSEIARRKERLIAASARQLAGLAAELGAWQKPFEVIDRSIAGMRFMKAHPALMLTGLMVVAVLGRRSLLRWAGRGLLVWRGWRALQVLARGLSV
jgi:hypothetical protein